MGSNIREAIAIFNDMTRDGVIDRYAIGGAVATLFHPTVTSSTRDVDVFIAFKPQSGVLLSLTPVYNYLKERGAEEEGEHITYHGWPIHILTPNSPLVEEALFEAEQVDVEGTPIVVFTIEYQAAIALETGRRKDKDRLDTFLTKRALDERTFLEIIKRYGLGFKYKDFQKWRKVN